MRQARSRSRQPDEPILTVTRSLQRTAQTDVPQCNLSSHARDILGMEPGDDADVEIFMDKIVIRPKHHE